MTNLGRIAYLLLGGLLLLLGGTACRPQVSTYSAARVAIPDHLTSPEERRDYLVAHYWDRLQEAPDVSPSELRLLTEDYCDFIAGLPAQQVRSSLRRGLSALPSSSLALALPIYKEYLYTAGRTSYDEALYGEVLRWVASSDRVDSVAKVDAVLELRRLAHNAPGTLAQDFRYHVQDTLSYRLRDLQAPYTLLLLLKDSTSQLATWGRELQASPQLTRLVQQGRLRPLAIYTGSTRPDSLARTRLPQQTIWAYDSAGLIARERCYDLRQGSVIYLLDADKRILLRNATFPQIHHTLQLDEE